MGSLIYCVLLAFAVQLCQGQVCKDAGVQCDTNCANVVLCSTPGGTPTVITKCATGSFCGFNGTWHDCSHDHCSDPYSPHKFQCLQVGTFPSPYICGKYFICTKINDVPTLECVCPDGQYFDIPSQSCKPEPGCPRTPVDCLKPGQSGMVENYCYSCNDKFDAYVYRCNYKESNYPEMSVTPRVETCKPYSGNK